MSDYVDDICNIQRQLSAILEGQVSLLDHFAGLAMQGMISSAGIGSRSDIMVAERSYDLAEAMLAERKRRMR